MLTFCLPQRGWQQATINASIRGWVVDMDINTTFPTSNQTVIGAINAAPMISGALVLVKINEALRRVRQTNVSYRGALFSDPLQSRFTGRLKALFAAAILCTIFAWG
jgi:hypothetical protein